MRPQPGHEDDRRAVRRAGRERTVASLPGIASHAVAARNATIRLMLNAMYDRCMTWAWANYIRCLNNLPWKPF